ncbi:MAG TPA: hypothetical protein VHM20_01410, partial [Gammaproteobacteria bacterium]|nr:hypothetical protein [Gammaproteobacteria bacterium]
MQSQENKKELAITILKKAIQETQQELLLAAEDLKFQEFKDSILHFNRLVQRDFITKLTLDSEEEVQQIYASASADLKDEVNASTPLKTAYQRVLDWYHLRIMDAFLERKEGILYKSKAADKKNEEKKRADLVRRLKDSKDAIKNFNTILRKEHVTYKIKNVRSLPDAPLDKCFESLIKEENEYELSLDNSSYLLNLMKEREILLKKVVSLQE